LSVKGLYYIK